MFLCYCRILSDFTEFCVIQCGLGCGDARYRTLAESYANLSRDYENLRCQHRDVLVVYEDACAEMKLIKKTVLALQSLVSICCLCYCVFVAYVF